MARWPFTRRSRRGTIDSDNNDTTPFPEKVAPHLKAGPASLKNNQERSIKSKRRFSLGKQPRNLSIEPEPPLPPIDPIYHHNASVEDITALPTTHRVRMSPHLRAASRNDDADIPYDFRLNAASQLQSSNPKRPESSGRNKLSRSPSRRRPFQVSDLPLKLTKKRASDREVQEEDFRAMSVPASLPRRPGREDTGVLDRESMIVREGLNRSLSRPVSSISLPRPDTSRSNSRMGFVDSRSYRISVMDVISPRPIVRTQAPPYAMIAVGWTAPSSRAHSTRGIYTSGKQSFKGAAKLKRIEDLADDMDSTDLRTILERDALLKEKKKIRDAEKLQRKLERRAEKDRLQEEGEESGVGPSIPYKERTKASSSKEEGATATKRPRERTSRKQSKARAAEWDAPPPPAKGSILQDPFSDALETQDDSPVVPSRNRRRLQTLGENSTAGASTFVSSSLPIMKPIEVPDDNVTQYIEESADEEEFHDALAIPELPNFATSVSDLDQESAIPSPTASSFAQAFAREPQYYPQIHEVTEEPPAPLSATPSVTALPTVQSTPERKKRRPSGIFSFLRLGDRFKQRQRSQSEASAHKEGSFSNISRQQTAEDAPTAPSSALPNAPFFPYPSLNSTPNRSQSKFQEHLPEVIPNRPSSSQAGPPPANPSLMTKPLPVIPTSSLASIDSEGSWLTGRPVKRMLSDRSGQKSHQESESRESGPVTPLDDPFGNDDYLRRIATSFGEDVVTAKTAIITSRVVIPEQVEIKSPRSPRSPVAPPEPQLTLHGDLAKNPDIKPGLRVKSSEGLLRLRHDEESPDAETVPNTPKAKETNTRHDSTMPDVDQLNLELDSDESDNPRLERATSMRASRILDAKMINVKRSSRDGRSDLISSS
jgi:hypothetical protein